MSTTTSGLSKVYMSGSTAFTGFKHRINDVLQGKCFTEMARRDFSQLISMLSKFNMIKR